MKTLKTTILFLSLISANAMVGIDHAVEDHLENLFNDLSNISELIYLGQSESCDEVVDAYVIGKMGSIETAYNCNICLINDGGIATVDSQESVCSRD
jgi:hypothetical protein